MPRLKRWILLLIPSGISVFLFRFFIDNNRERNSNEAAKFLVDINVVYSTRYYLLLGKFLRFSLVLGDVGLPKPYVRVLVKSLKETRRNPARRKDACNEILNATLELNVQQSSPHGWKLVSLALSGLGFIRAGTVARNNCLTASLNQIVVGNASSRTLHLAIKGLLESRRFDEARKLIETHAMTLDRSSTRQIYSDYLSLLKQPRPNVSKHRNNIENESEKLFTSLIYKKRIALIAPGVISKEYGREIDSHDTVFRIKFNGQASMLQENFVGSRCDITSHNSELLQLARMPDFETNTALSNASDLKIIVAKKGESGMIGNVPVKRMTSWAPTFLTTGTSGTLALFETLRSAPKVINLFGFDFYTNCQIYNHALMTSYKNSHYPDGEDKRAFSWDGDSFPKAFIARFNISHDPKSDFLFVKNLYELSGLLDGTPEVVEILNLTADEYDMRLEEMLGDW